MSTPAKVDSESPGRLVVAVRRLVADSERSAASAVAAVAAELAAAKRELASREHELGQARRQLVRAEAELARCRAGLGADCSGAARAVERARTMVRKHQARVQTAREVVGELVRMHDRATSARNRLQAAQARHADAAWRELADLAARLEAYLSGGRAAIGGGVGGVGSRRRGSATGGGAATDERRHAPVTTIRAARLWSHPHEGSPALDGSPALEGSLRRADESTPRTRILCFLEGGSAVPGAAGSAEDPVAPDRRGVVPIGFRTDGAWLWPEELAYHLREHDILPEPDFLAHMRSREFVAARASEAELAEATELLTSTPET